MGVTICVEKNRALPCNTKVACKSGLSPGCIQTIGSHL